VVDMPLDLMPPLAIGCRFGSRHWNRKNPAGECQPVRQAGKALARTVSEGIIARVKKIVAHPITVFISRRALAPPRIVPTVQVAL
jgi:hypothetical protein